MKKKIPFYRSGLLIGLILFIVGGSQMKKSSDVATAVMLTGFVMFLVALIRRIIALFKKSEPVVAQVHDITTQNSIPLTAAAASGPLSNTEPAKAREPVKKPFKIEGHRVAGTSYHRDEIETMGTYNVDYDMTAAEIRDSYDEWDRVYEYVFNPSKVELVPEPENEHDSNAIRVEVDGHHVGYIKQGSNAHIRKLMRENRIVDINAEIGGGKYKQLDGDRHVTKERTEYYVKLALKVKE